METAESEAEKVRQSARRLEDEVAKAKKAAEKDLVQNAPASSAPSDREEELQTEIKQLMVGSCVPPASNPNTGFVRPFCAARPAITNYEHMSL